MHARALADRNRAWKTRYRGHKHEHNKAPQLMDEEEFEKAAGLDNEGVLPEILSSTDSVTTKHEKMVKIATEKAA